MDSWGVWGATLAFLFLPALVHNLPMLRLALLDLIVEQLHLRSNYLASKFMQSGGRNYIDEAITLDREALKLFPPSRQKRAFSLTLLSIHLWNRYEQLQSMTDIEEAIMLGREALAVHSPGNPDRSITLINLSACLCTRYEQLGGMEDLNEAVALIRDTLALCGPGHPFRSKALYNLAHYLSTRYKRFGRIDDLDEAIILGKDVLALSPPRHPDRLRSLINVSAYLSARYTLLGRIEDLHEGIVLARNTVALCTPEHPLRSTALDNVGIHLSNRYQRLGEMEDLDEAIILGRDALVLRPPGHPERSASLDNVAARLSIRFEQLGGRVDLDEAISLGRDALALRPHGHLDRSTSLINVAKHLYSRYQLLGGVEDLDEAIILGRDSLVLNPSGHPHRSMSLSNVALYLSTRYERLRGMEDIEEAVVLGRNALALRPLGHPDRSMSLNNLANYLATRYQRLGRAEDLDEAILLGRDALALRPPGHPDRSMSLHNISKYLHTRYQRLGGLEDLDEAITLGRGTLALRPPGHPIRPISLSNIAMYLSMRHERLGGVEDLEEAIILGRDALALCPPGYPHRSGLLVNLAGCLHTLFTRSNQLADKEELFGLYTQMAHMPETASSAALSATRTWIYMAEHFQHPTTLTAYETSLRSLVRYLAALPSLPQHLDVLKEITSSLAVDAFSACLRYRSPTKAVEFLEQGRSVFWSQLTRLNAPLDHVVASGSAGKALAKKFTELTMLIRNAQESYGADQHDRVCHLNMELQRVVDAIRELPGLSRFLLPSLFSDLQQAASGGPVIIVNSSMYGCDALIVLLDRDPVHIPLQITRTDVRKLTSEFYTWISRAKLMSVAKYLVVILRKLWDKVVSPIVTILQMTHPSLSRIWWCPTAEFSLLPLHAASSYRKGEKGLTDLYVSSYTPTLIALIRARRHELPRTGEGKRFVGIGQANAMGTSELHSVGAELASIARHVDGLVEFTRIEGPDSCIPRVVQELHKNQWAHLACHGLPSRQQPFKSAFALHDGHFTIEQIIRCELPNAQFAYLSACHTTAGDEDCPDEMIHLASAMQFAGFRSVIGTMWAVDDEQAKKITSIFYGNMVGESGRLDHTRAALALHKTMNEDEGISFDQRILYVHLGA